MGSSEAACLLGFEVFLRRFTLLIVDSVNHKPLTFPENALIHDSGSLVGLGVGG